MTAPSGRVLAFDARTGAARWSFDPLPRDKADPAAAGWARGSAEGIGGGDVWSTMSVDDFYGAMRPGDNRYANSVLALHGATGKVAWSYQFTHHDVRDYDTPTAPILIDYPVGGRSVPAVVQLTKTGMIFLLNREIGQPLSPVVERPVPQAGGVPGEVLFRTQPFPVGMPRLGP